jgi:hypothetical protein
MRMFLASIVCLALACAAEIGEECDETGETGGCVDGGICDTDEGTAICLELCDTDADCAAEQECTGVSGSNKKACHTKKP